MAQSQQITIRVEEFLHILEPLIRRVVREELERLVEVEPNIFYLEPDMPLYQDMEDILERKEQDNIKLHSHEEVWGE